MLQINNLSLGFGDQELLRDVSFNIHAGERIGLVGRNGSGKTTLFRILTGEMNPDEGTITRPRNYTIGYLKQHLNFTMPTVLEEACLGLPEDEKDQVWKAEKMLMGLGFSETEQGLSPSYFSGGFQVRLNLAKVLLAEPHLLLLDEPTNYLDILSIRWLAKFLRQRENELMIITHDRDFMNAVITHSMAIHRKKIKKIEGNTQKLFDQIAIEEEIYEQTRLREEKERAKTEEFINRFRAKANLASMVQSRIKALDRLGRKEELEKIAELGFRFNSLPLEAKCPMRIENLSFGYTQDRILINGLSIDINKDDRICVIGKNGRGKSTLLRLMQGELQPVTGTIKKHPMCATGYFGQTNIERLDKTRTIEKELATVRPDLKYQEIRKVAGAMMFTGDLALKEISVLSGGEKSRVSLGKILLNPSNLLLLDEPTNHLDIESCDSMIAALDMFDGAVVIVTHSELFLHHLANRLIVFTENGVSVFEGTYQDFLDRVGWEEEIKPKKAKKEKTSDLTARQKEEAEAVFLKKKKFIMAKIAALEKKIDDSEEILEKTNAELAESYGKAGSAEIQKMQINSHAAQEELNKGYAELETLIAELDALEKQRPA